MPDKIEILEQRLLDRDKRARADSLRSLMHLADRGELSLPEPTDYLNLHMHSFFSYNPDGLSPSALAWRARKAGLGLAGLVDFDVLDGVDEFHAAGAALGVKTVAGVETRAFVPEFSDREINSPGEPGIAYHMGAGMISSEVPPAQRAFLDQLKRTAQERNRGLLERVNPFMEPVTLDLERDVFPLTPADNPTERHLCAAYEAKALERYGDAPALRDFWREKLGDAYDDSLLPSGGALQAAIRSRTMKKGGVGYVRPEGGSFPTMADVNSFVLASGGIPVLAWLNGLTEGERAIDELLDVARSTGAAAVNIIPDRNYTAGVRDEKLEALYALVEKAEARDLPILIGTELNAPGLKFVDELESGELSPLWPAFLNGGHIVFAHTVLQRAAGMGYCSAWARRAFPDAAARNVFYRVAGETLRPGCAPAVNPSMSADEVMRALSN
jgi:hypothetical protein